ncbi:hypothetical protein [Flaviaesturariibacter aridisoli]|uniref:DUF4148 domain-containing protein n=1 Tax=Flaviaesturariibacter aridisoli TaxID=2545761 RepID=A0A4R4DVE7_9BACT|nr:hypothetical protein [Flaviaesturariibacter aridisoli]TCZ66420.1 hypothetical protein E0486_16680 [Flaviaesturariibacter aridisoli]
MNRLLLVMLASAGSLAAAAQTVPDQNPSYAVSRDKYLKVADSVNRWHSTTAQNTYKAYDWYEAREERRQARRQNRYDVRLARAQRNYRNWDYNPYYNDSYYYNPRSSRRWQSRWW